MLAILVGTHGHFATELLKTCEMICGETTNVRAITLVPGESPDDVLKKYEDALQEMDTENGVLFLNDLFGGSPYNAACRLAIGHKEYGIVTGVNLPMLIEMIGVQAAGEEDSIQEIMERAVAAGNMGTRTFHANDVQEDEEDDL